MWGPSQKMASSKGKKKLKKRYIIILVYHSSVHAHFKCEKKYLEIKSKGLKV